MQKEKTPLYYISNNLIWINDNKPFVWPRKVRLLSPLIIADDVKYYRKQSKQTKYPFRNCHKNYPFEKTNSSISKVNRHQRPLLKVCRYETQLCKETLKNRIVSKTLKFQVERRGGDPPLGHLNDRGLKMMATDIKSARKVQKLKLDCSW